jgi:hypothetical protein
MVLLLQEEEEGEDYCEQQQWSGEDVGCGCESRCSQRRQLW